MLRGQAFAAPAPFLAPAGMSIDLANAKTRRAITELPNTPAMVLAVCTNCHILLGEASNASLSNLTAAVTEAAALGATEISNSYGGPEFSGETAFDATFDHPAIAITASSGDSGFGTLDPASSQFVTAGGWHKPGPRLQRSGLGRDHIERCRQWLQRVRVAARLAGDQCQRDERVRPPSGGRRVHRRRPEHGRFGLRQLRLPGQQRLAAVRRDQRCRSDRRLGVCAGGRGQLPARRPIRTVTARHYSTWYRAATSAAARCCARPAPDGTVPPVSAPLTAQEVSDPAVSKLDRYLSLVKGPGQWWLGPCSTPEGQPSAEAKAGTGPPISKTCSIGRR